MFNRILDSFVIPNSSAEETHLVGRWLIHIFLFAFGILSVYAIVAFTLKLDNDTLIFIGVFLILFGGLFVLLEKGYVRLAGLLFYLSSLLGMSFAAYQFGGVRSASYNALIIVIIISAIFLRGRLTVIATSISINSIPIIASFSATYYAITAILSNAGCLIAGQSRLPGYGDCKHCAITGFSILNLAISAVGTLEVASSATVRRIAS